MRDSQTKRGNGERASSNSGLRENSASCVVVDNFLNRERSVKGGKKKRTGRKGGEWLICDRRPKERAAA